MDASLQQGDLVRSQLAEVPSAVVESITEIDAPNADVSVLKREHTGDQPLDPVWTVSTVGTRRFHSLSLEGLDNVPAVVTVHRVAVFGYY